MMTIVLALRARTPHSNTTYVFRVSKGIACRKMLFGKTLIVGGSDFWYQSQSKFSSHSFIFAIVIWGWKAMLVHSSWLKIWPDKSSVRRFVVPQTCFMRVLKPIGSFHTRNIKKSLRKLICAVFKSVMDSKRICLVFECFVFECLCLSVCVWVFGFEYLGLSVDIQECSCCSNYYLMMWIWVLRSNTISSYFLAMWIWVLRSNTISSYFLSQWIWVPRSNTISSYLLVNMSATLEP